MVTPTEHLKTQWAAARPPGRHRARPAFRRRRRALAATTPASRSPTPGSRPARLAARRRTEARRTLVILDEIHHGGDALSWGEAVREAFEPATRRLALTGTPFRSDTSPIPFVTYAPGPDGVRRSVADYTYGYGDALRDGVVRPVIFLAYGGQMRWRTSAGDEVAAALGEPLTRDVTAQAWRTALDGKGDWIPQVLRRGRHPADPGAPRGARRRRAGDRHRPGRRPAPTPRCCARSPARRRRWCCPTTPRPASRIDEFAGSDDRWMVAVRMVSEGVDVPRLAVGVYATSVATPLFFAQAVGRFVRARRRGETRQHLPAAAWRRCWRWPAQMELERDHVLDRPRRDDDDLWAPEDDLLAAAQRPPRRRRRPARVRGARGRGRPSTGCSSTAASSGRAPVRRSARRRRPTSSGCPGCSSPTR